MYSPSMFYTVNTMRAWLQKVPAGLILVLCLTYGLAPFAPPHVWEKLVMLMNGELIRPIDWFDLFAHGSPWVLLVIKLTVGRQRSQES